MMLSSHRSFGLTSVNPNRRVLLSLVFVMLGLFSSLVEFLLLFCLFVFIFAYGGFFVCFCLFVCFSRLSPPPPPFPFFFPVFMFSVIGCLFVCFRFLYTFVFVMFCCSSCFCSFHCFFVSLFARSILSFLCYRLFQVAFVVYFSISLFSLSF